MLVKNISGSMASFKMNGLTIMCGPNQIQTIPDQFVGENPCFSIDFYINFQKVTGSAANPSLNGLVITDLNNKPVVDTTSRKLYGQIITGIALQFDGQNSVITSYSSAFETFPLTIEFWYMKINSTNLQQSLYVVPFSDSTNRADGWFIEMDYNNGMSIYFNNQPYGTYAGTIPSDTNWHHIAYTIDGSNNINLYIDGTNQLLTNTLAPSFTPGSNLVIGNTQSESNVGFIGRLEEIRLSNVVRYTDTFNPSTLSEFATDLNTLALWHFNEGTGMIAYDASGNNHIAVLRGDPTPIWLAGLFGGNSLYLPLINLDNQMLLNTNQNNTVDWNNQQLLSNITLTQPIQPLLRGINRGGGQPINPPTGTPMVDWSGIQNSSAYISFDSANNTYFIGGIVLAAQSSQPTPVLGGIYFDGSTFWACPDGSTWMSINLTNPLQIL